MCEAETLNSLLRKVSEEAPDAVFLSESPESSLTYSQTYRLVSSILRARLYSLCPQIVSPASIQSKVALISHNNSLFPLALWACWHLSVEVTLLSVNMDPFLWKAAINVIDPQLIIASRDVHAVLVKQLDDGLLERRIVTIDDLIPPQYRIGISESRKSDYIPSLHKWLLEVHSDLTADGSPFISSTAVTPELPTVTLFTSSAVDTQSLKCVTYTHSMLVRSGERTIDMMGGLVYRSRPVRHLGWLPLSHCFEFCISLM